MLLWWKTVENVSHSCQRWTNITNSNILAVQELLDIDRRLIISKIASNVRISFGSVHKISADDFGLRKVPARLVHILLTDPQKEIRNGSCKMLLTWYEINEEEFFYTLTICDEVWAYQYFLDYNRLSIQWKKSKGRASMKAETRLSTRKFSKPFFGITRVSIIFMKDVPITVPTITNFWIKLISAVDKEGEVWPFEVWNCFMTTLSLTQPNLMMKTFKSTLETLGTSTPQLGIVALRFPLVWPYERSNGDNHFKDDVESFVRKWLLITCFNFLQQNKKLSISWKICVSRRWDSVKRMKYFWLFDYYENKSENKFQFIRDLLLYLLYYARVIKYSC